MLLAVENLSLDQILKLVEIISILGGGALVAFKLGRTSSRFEAALDQQKALIQLQSEEISELRIETKKLGDVLTAIAVQGNRLDRVEADIRELRHGKGYVLNNNGPNNARG